MLMPASEAWKKVENEIASDLKQIEEAVEDAIKRKSGHATVKTEIIESDAVQQKLKSLGYRWKEGMFNKSTIYFSHENQSK